jgi:hypothetical protein
MVPSIETPQASIRLGEDRRLDLAAVMLSAKGDLAIERTHQIPVAFDERTPPLFTIAAIQKAV